MIDKCDHTKILCLVYYTKNDVTCYGLATCCSQCGLIFERQFCILGPNGILSNKEILDKYSILPKYELVRSINQRFAW